MERERPVVLYLHGLESGPQGRKARALAASGLHLRALQMPSSVRAMARDPLALGGLAVAAALTAGLGAPVGGRGAAAAILLAAAGVPWLRGALVRRSFRAGLAQQRAALAAGDVSLVVGSSYGGAVALALLHEGVWRGPTLLLCPAWRQVAAYARTPAPAGLAALPRAVAERVWVVHGRQDETVPFSDSEALVQGSAARLIAVEDDHRLSRSTTTALSAWAWGALQAHP